jgi:hypothetical protein
MSGKADDQREALAKLRSDHLEKVKVLNDLKDRQLELQTQMLAAQDAVFKTYQTFAAASERFLVGVIGDQTTQLKAAQAAQVSAAVRQLPTITEERRDNLQQ